MFYFAPKLFNWDLCYISQKLIDSIYNNQYVANKWKLYFENKIDKYCSCTCCYNYSNHDSNDKTTQSKVSYRVSNQMATFKAAHDIRYTQLQPK